MSAALQERTVVNRVRREYSDSEKAEALLLIDAHKGNLREVERLTGIPDSTLSSWRDGKHINSDVPKIREFKRLGLAEKYEQTANKFINLAYQNANSKTSIRELVSGSCASAEKMLLLRGQPTSITENIDRKELAIILRQAIETGLDLAIDVTPEHNLVTDSVKTLTP